MKNISVTGAFRPYTADFHSAQRRSETTCDVGQYVEYPDATESKNDRPRDDGTLLRVREAPLKLLSPLFGHCPNSN